MSMCSEEEEESEDEDGEERDAASVYVSLFAVVDRMERWYASGARECPEDHVLRVEALLRREPPVTNVFETREAVDGPNVGGVEVTTDVINCNGLPQVLGTGQMACLSVAGESDSR